MLAFETDYSLITERRQDVHANRRRSFLIERMPLPAFAARYFSTASPTDGISGGGGGRSGIHGVAALPNCPLHLSRNSRASAKPVAGIRPDRTGAFVR
jgi:hypothetical protein